MAAPAIGSGLTLVMVRRACCPFDDTQPGSADPIIVLAGGAA